MTGIPLQTNRIGRRQQVLSAMGQPQAQPPITQRNKKPRGGCFSRVIQRLMTSNFSEEEKQKAKHLLARLFGKGNRYNFGKQYILFNWQFIQ